MWSAMFVEEAERFRPACDAAANFLCRLRRQSRDSGQRSRTSKTKGSLTGENAIHQPASPTRSWGDVAMIDIRTRESHPLKAAETQKEA